MHGLNINNRKERTLPNGRDKMTNGKAINWLAIAAIAAICAPLATLLGIGFGYVISTQPDFALSVHPLQPVASIPSDVTVKIIVKDLHHVLHKYQNQIILMSDIVSGDNIPEIAFDPPGFDPNIYEGSTYTSMMRIRLGRDVTPGTYKIRIMGIGGDGKERSCTIFLKAIQTGNV